MQLPIDGTVQTLIPIQQFRQEQVLPSDFGVATFEPKQFDGLATIDRVGVSLKQLRQTMLDAIPERIQFGQLQTLFDTLQTQFRQELEAINSQINLKPAELDFAVAGFGDANQAFFYAIIRERHAPQTIDFRQVYWQWMADSTNVSYTVHDYQHDDHHWQIQIVNTVYGRIGLKIVEDETVFYVADGIYACPAQGYMTLLAQDIIEQIVARLEQA